LFIISFQLRVVLGYSGSFSPPFFRTLIFSILAIMIITVVLIIRRIPQFITKLVFSCLSFFKIDLNQTNWLERSGDPDLSRNLIDYWLLKISSNFQCSIGNLNGFSLKLSSHRVPASLLSNRWLFSLRRRITIAWQFSGTVNSISCSFQSFVPYIIGLLK